MDSQIKEPILVTGAASRVGGVGRAVVDLLRQPPGLPPRWAQPHLELFASKVIPAIR